MAIIVESVQPVSGRQRQRRRLLWLAVIWGLVIGFMLWLVYTRAGSNQESQDGAVPFALRTIPPLPILPPQHLPVPDIPVPVPPLTVVNRIATTDPVIFVTIDDGVFRPEDATQYMNQHRIPSIAFLTTSMVTRDPGYFVGLHRAGAGIANHTLAHPHMPRLTPPQQQHEICGASDQLKAWFGVRPRLFRPPYGEYDDHTKHAATACGISHLVLWNVVMDKGILSYQHPGGLAAGDIVLMHFRPELKHELELLTQAAQARGLQFARLEDYLR